MVDMIALKTRLNQWCQSYSQVIAIYLFGSQAEGRATIQSDIDLAVLVDPHVDRSTLWRLEDRWPIEVGIGLQEVGQVDLFILNLAPLDVRFHIITQGKRLVTPDFTATIEYESYTCRLYWDFQPYLRQQQAQLHARIKEQWDDTQRRHYQQTLVQTQSVHRRVKATTNR